MSTARRHSSTVTSSVGLLAEMPALLTSTSMPPQVSATCAKARSTASASVTDACTAMACAPVPVAARSATAASSAAASMSSSATRAPWRANASAVL
jgi:hypothetical protein